MKSHLDNQQDEVLCNMDDLNTEFSLQLIGSDRSYLFGTAYKINGIYKISLDGSSYELLYQDMPVETQYHIVGNKAYAINHSGLYKIFSDGSKEIEVATF